MLNLSLSVAVPVVHVSPALQLPVMDLHQGSNEYNPLRTKPITAAMKQDQKHIEGSVYDPRTGKTVVSSAVRFQDAPGAIVDEVSCCRLLVETLSRRFKRL